MQKRNNVKKVGTFIHNLLNTPIVYILFIALMITLMSIILNVKLASASTQSETLNIHIEDYTECGMVDTSGYETLKLTHGNFNPVVSLNGIWFGTVPYYTEYKLNGLDKVFISDVSFIWESEYERATKQSTKNTIKTLTKKYKNSNTSIQTFVLNIIIQYNNKNI
jgi:hypothetical protein